MPAGVPIVSFSGQVKSAESPVQDQCFLQRMRVAIDTRLELLRYLMPVGAQGTSRFPELVVLQRFTHELRTGQQRCPFILTRSVSEDSVNPKRRRGFRRRSSWRSLAYALGWYGRGRRMGKPV